MKEIEYLLKNGYRFIILMKENHVNPFKQYVR